MESSPRQAQGRAAAERQVRPKPIAGIAHPLAATALAVELGGIKQVLMGRAVQSTMDAAVAATERLKTLLESAPGA